MSDKLHAIIVNGSNENTDEGLIEKPDHLILDSSEEIAIKTLREKNKTQNSLKTVESFPPKDSPTICDVSHVEMKSVLKQELEAIFSQENFSKDKFLISQLDSDHYISLGIVMQLKQIKRLTRNADLILDLLKELPNLQVDTLKTKIRFATPRSTIILREVPETIPREVIEKLFSSTDCPPSVRCEFAGNENWYVTFLTEEDAHKAYNHLREKVQNFLGKPIMARIKTSSTFISSSTKATSSAVMGRLHHSTSNVADLIQQNPPLFSSQSSAPLSNYFVSKQFPFCSPEMVSSHVWQQKFMEQYNMSFRHDLLYTQPFYGYCSQNTSGISFEGTSRQNKSSNTLYSHNHHHQSQHKSDQWGGYFQRHSGSHNENKPPPRFLRQQLANSTSSDVASTENHDFDFSNVDLQVEKNSSDSRPDQNLLKTSFTGNDIRHVPNGFAKGTPACKSPVDKDRECCSNRGKRFTERRGAYRGGRRRNIEEGDKNKQAQQQEREQQSPKSRDTPTFLLESSSFPPLPLISNTSMTPSTSIPSYVQAVAKSSSVVHPLASQQKSFRLNHVLSNDSPPSSSLLAAFEPRVFVSSNSDINEASYGGSKMPSFKCSYAEIAQRTIPSNPSKGHDESLDIFSSCMKADCAENSPACQLQHVTWSRKKQDRRNGEVLKTPHFKNLSVEEDMKAMNSKNEVERCEKVVKAFKQRVFDDVEDKLMSIRIN